jgi:hypothetical protein
MTKKMKQLIMFILGFIFLGFIAYFAITFLFFIYIYGTGCKYNYISGIYSYDNNYKASLYSRDCGTLASSSLLIKLQKLKNKKLFSSNEETVFIFDDENKNVYFDWIGDNLLKVIYSPKIEVIRQLDTWQDVKIEYVPINASEK